VNDRRALIEARLAAALAPVELAVRDDSAAHAGHAGHGGAGHFSVRIVATRFAGLSRLARHRLVFDALAPLMGPEIHALSIEAESPAESSLSAGSR
jgi:BolA family transcriptional regulator, general stress-responsive regulator